MARPRSELTPSQIDDIIGKNLQKLNRPGVLTVRPGHEIADDQLTGHRAIVATVHTKKPKATLSKKALLPETIEGVPVDVREASAFQRLRSHDPASAELTQTYGRPETIEPDWPYEREMPSGLALTSSKSHTQQSLVAHKNVQTGTVQALAAHAKKPEETYVPPAGVSLAPLSTTATLIASVSPDDELKTLTAFLEGTQSSLVVGMYDFTSGTILKTFESVLAGGKTLQMVLDNPAPNRTADQSDTQTVLQLNTVLSADAQIVRALDRMDIFAAAWIFPSAYHIKVIVRDASTVWLSSGNLNNSNQPNPAMPPTTEDRDWHIVIDDPDIARVFKAYLDQDFASAKAHQVPDVEKLEEQRALQNARAKLAAEANPSPVLQARTAKTPTFAAQTFADEQATVTLLFTPDSLPDDPSQGQYLSNIMALIEGATTSIDIQLQYIEASSGKGDVYDLLLGAIAKKAQQSGVTVRLIESAEYGIKWAEKMKDAGVDLTANIWLQPNVHNKGFVIDSQTVVVSSQNFSPAGVRTNRDAGVIIQSPQIAEFFGKVFAYDFQYQAKAVSTQPAASAKASPSKTKAKAKSTTKTKTTTQAKPKGKTGTTAKPQPKQAKTSKAADAAPTTKGAKVSRSGKGAKADPPTRATKTTKATKTLKTTKTIKATQSATPPKARKVAAAGKTTKQVKAVEAAKPVKAKKAADSPTRLRRTA
jgi:phosphatidylserine/phosphatidylglycerophosphate/cardiolipin synthase-like enzyme